MEYGIQMYGVRDLASVDLKEALRQVAAIGYKYVEFAGFFDHSAEEVAGWLSEFGLRTSGTHSGMDGLLHAFDDTVAYHKAIGNCHYIIPGTDLWTRAKLDEFIANVNEVQPKLEQVGFTLGFHNHHREFATMDEGYVPYDELTARTKLKLEIDTYWAYVAGKNPVELMEKYRDRLQFIHIKDGSQDGHGTPLGMGTAPVAAVYRKAVEMGIPMVVESETCTPTGMDEARICFEYLKKLERGEA